MTFVKCSFDHEFQNVAVDVLTSLSVLLILDTRLDSISLLFQIEYVEEDGMATPEEVVHDELIASMEPTFLEES